MLYHQKAMADSQQAEGAVGCWRSPAPVQWGGSCMSAGLGAVPFAECFAHSHLQSIINICNANNLHWNALWLLSASGCTFFFKVSAKQFSSFWEPVSLPQEFQTPRGDKLHQLSCGCHSSIEILNKWYLDWVFLILIVKISRKILDN